MKKKYTCTILLSAMAIISADAVNQRWNGSGGDGLWTTAANWNTATVPVIADNVANWTAQSITLDAAGFADRFWSRNPSVGNNLIIETNGSLTVTGDVTINEFSGEGYLYSELNLNGGVLNVGTNLSIAGQSSSQGEGLLVLNSGSVNVAHTNKIGTAGLGVGVKGVVDMYGGSYTVEGATILGGGNLSTDSGTLNIYGGVYNEGTNGSAAAMQIGVGSGSGALNLYDGSLFNNHGLEMGVQSEIHIESGVLYWSGDRLTDVTALVNSNYLTWQDGLSDTLTESWDASWTYSQTNDYGYWSAISESELYADVDDVTNGFTTVWAVNLTPTAPSPVTDGVANTHIFNNSSGDQLWTTSNNWDIGMAPTLEDTVNHTANGDTLVVATDVEAAALNISHNSTASVAVVHSGSLQVAGNAEIGNVGATGVGKLIVDGGDVSIGGDVYFSLFGTTRTGIGELNSGSMTVGGETVVGANNTASGILTINGGTYTATDGFFYVGKSAGAGTLNMNGGTLQLHTGSTVWNPLRVGNGTGDGTVNLNGGVIRTRGMIMDNTVGGSSTINLNDGLLQVEGSFLTAVQLKNAAQMVFDAGVFQWKGDWVSDFSTFVDGGFISWTNGMSNMVYETFDASWTNGTSILFAEFADGYTTVWAFDTLSLPVGYDSFVVQYDLQEGPEGDDDKDNVSNLLEYAINGNPTNGADKGVVELSSDGSVFSYVHAKLADDSSIVYRLIDTPNLVNQSLTTNGYVSQVNGPVDGDYLTVTNNYDMTGKAAQFIELEIEQQ